jgi:hypothetical protein
MKTCCKKMASTTRLEMESELEACGFFPRTCMEKHGFVGRWIDLQYLVYVIVFGERRDVGNETS